MGSNSFNGNEATALLARKARPDRVKGWLSPETGATLVAAYAAPAVEAGAIVLAVVKTREGR
jgi:hypothetical protein